VYIQAHKTDGMFIKPKISGVVFRPADRRAQMAFVEEIDK
jgi:hypothetical protein